MELVNHERAILLLQQGKATLAEQELRRSLALDQEDALAHTYLALCLVEQKRLDEALAEIKQAIVLDPVFAFAHYVLAEIHYRNDRYKEAQQAIKEGLRLNPDDADYYQLLGNVFFIQRKYREALEAAETGLSLEPEHVDCLNLRARVLVKLGRKDIAQDAFKASFQQQPDNAITHANQGWAYLETGETKLALEHFREALRQRPTLEFAREGMVEALKAKYWIYRGVLKLSFAMDRLSAGARWGMMIGIILVVRIVPVLLPFYLVVVFFSWFSDMIFDSLLRLNSFGKHALSKQQVLASNTFMGVVAAGVLALGGGKALDIPLLVNLGLVLLALLFPIAGTFRVQGPARRKSLTCFYGLAGLGVFFVVAEALALPVAALSFTVFVIGTLAYTWYYQSLVNR